MSDDGIPGGCRFAPCLGNLYLHTFDVRFPMSTRYGDNIIIVAPNADYQVRQLTTQLNDIGLIVHEKVPNPERFCNFSIQSRAETAPHERQSTGLTVGWRRQPKPGR